MSDAEKPVVIVIKRITKKNAHHGGSWKIAYADFVTAMMAFFMLMWMLSMLNKFQLQGISNYFKKPMKNIFIGNQAHNTNIPFVPAKHTELNELAPTKTTKDGYAHKKNTAVLTYQPKDDSGTINQQKTGANVVVNSKSINHKQQGDHEHLQGKEKEELEQLKKSMEVALKADPQVNQYKDLLTFKVTDDGLKINISSLKNKPMFSTGKTDFQAYAANIMQWLTKELDKTPRKITVIGHTDTEIYNSASNYTNWELSTDRASATRRLLINAGMDKDRVLRVQGAGSSSLLFKNDGLNPANRRIEIIILSNQATERFINE
ncbi:MAG: flagellar motor protein MotB [Legionellales bacterium]